MVKLLRRLILTTLLLLIFLVAILWFAPASLLGYFLEKQQAPLQLGMLKGQLRNGSAEQARWQGIDLGKLEWKLEQFKFKPPSTLINVHATGPQMQVQGILRATEDLITSHSLYGNFPASWIDLQGLAPLLFANGEINFNFSNLDISADNITTAVGVMDWHNASLTGLLEVALGDIHFDISTAQKGELNSRLVSDNQTILVKFGNQGVTELELVGTINSDGKRYQLDCLARASANREDITRFLQKAGKAEAGGAYRIQFEGLFSPEN